MGCRSPIRCAEGQASAEYVGLTALVALAFIAALAVAPRPFAAVPAAVAGTLCAAVDAACAERPQPPSEEELVERWLAADLTEFLAYRASDSRDARLDWSTDLCSAPVVGSEGRTFDFADACIRHDFGYRNYADLGLFRERRRAVDERFLADMRGLCRSQLPWELGRC